MAAKSRPPWTQKIGGAAGSPPLVDGDADAVGVDTALVRSGRRRRGRSSGAPRRRSSCRRRIRSRPAQRDARRPGDAAPRDTVGSTAPGTGARSVPWGPERCVERRLLASWPRWPCPCRLRAHSARRRRRRHHRCPRCPPHHDHACRRSTSVAGPIDVRDQSGATRCARSPPSSTPRSTRSWRSTRRSRTRARSRPASGHDPAAADPAVPTTPRRPAPAARRRPRPRCDLQLRAGAPVSGRRGALGARSAMSAMIRPRSKSFGV